jgi:two-component system, NtrC family, sensor kinase
MKHIPLPHLDAAIIRRAEARRRLDESIEHRLLKENELIGSFSLYRQEVRPFSDKQIALVTSFAAQAVIAIENARLLNELRQRTTDLTEALEQQTATSDVLKVISRSTFDLQIRAHYGATREAVQYALLHPLPADRSSTTGRVALERKTIHLRDVLADPEYHAPDYQQAFGSRTTLGVPLLRDGTMIGVFTLGRHEVKPFTDKQIELMTTFADQAVIAIENVRLFEAEQQRTRELTESLQQQTATAGVLEVISRSAFDLQAVFDTVAASSVRLCAADRAFIFRFDGELLQVAATCNVASEWREWVKQNPIRPGRHAASARAALERKTIHIPDVLADPEYTYGARDKETVRTILAVPILKGDDLLGVIMVYRLAMKPFTDQQTALVETFADQAAIRPGAPVQLMRLTLFLVVDSAAGMSAVMAITLPELGAKRNLRGLS